MNAGVSAVLFAKDARQVATFYFEVFGAKVLSADRHHSLLEFHGFHLMVHQIPEALAGAVVVSTPPRRRETGAIRLDYPVNDIAALRRKAKQFGGQIDEKPPVWAGEDTSFFLGIDPEGNVFGVKEA